MLVITKKVLPDSKEIEEKLDQRLEEHSNGDEKESSDEGAPQEESIGEKDKNETPNTQKSPWQTSAHHASPEEESSNQLEDTVEEETSKPNLRRSKRARKSHPKYANAAVVEGPNIKEPSTYEEAY